MEKFNQSIKNNIISVWNEIENQLNSKKIFVASEKTLVFEFAWRLLKKYPNYKELNFEKVVLQNQKKKSFLDLYVKLSSGKKALRIGIEFKFPKTSSNNNGSGQTQVRQKSIKDVARLCKLKDQKEIDLGCFLFATNEKGYFTHNEKLKFSTIGQIFKLEEFLPTNEDGIPFKPTNELYFNWNTTNIKSGTFVFMDPVFVY